jgi:hypothetical protein
LKPSRSNSKKSADGGPVIGNLPFISLLVGIFFAAAVNIYNNKYYFKQFKANGNKPVPEARLPPMMVGGFAFTAGLFIFACTMNSGDRVKVEPG